MECALCTEVHTYFGLPKCGHKSICSLCWYRMRSILDSKSCPLCRQTSDYVFITSSATLEYDSILRTGWNDSFKGFTLDMKSQIYFEDQAELQRLLNFKQLACKYCTLEIKNFPQYKDHIFRFHNKKICEVCLNNNKLFPSEQELYEDSQLNIHKINHHSQCDLCFDYYYDQRKLLEHIKSKHFFCELCDVTKRTAYSNYSDLEGHYRQAHFLCEVGICRDETHIVFMCYDDLKDHYRSNHIGIPVPAPVCAFRVRDDEEKPEMFFEDVESKNYSVPKITEQNKDFEFPALGGLGSSSVTEQKNVIDYSKISKKKNQKKACPEVFSNDLFPSTPESKPEPKPKANKNVKKQELPLLEKNIARLNNGHITIEELVEQLQDKDRENISATISTIRRLVLSNTNKEKLVKELEKPQKRVVDTNPVKQENLPKNKPVLIEEEKKISSKNAKVQQSWPGESFPALGDAKAPKVKTEFNTLLENIVIYNNKLITAKYFVDSILEFMPRSEVNLYRKTIRDKVRPEGRAFEALNLLDHELLMTANESEYPSLVSKKEKECPPDVPKNEKDFPSLSFKNEKDYPALGKSTGQKNVNKNLRVLKQGIPMKGFFIN